MRSRHLPLLALLLATIAHAQPPAKSPAPAAPAADGGPFTVPQSQVFDLTDRARGTQHRVMIWRPHTPPPPSGYPVLYLLDGNGAFPIAAALMDARARRPMGSGGAPAVIVGLGYPIEAPYDHVRRTEDLTPPSQKLTLPPRPNGAPWPKTGGAEGFLRFIEDQVKPKVAEVVKIDPDQEALMGHSFGGLLTLYTLVNHPEAFDLYFAGSPSLWFNEGQISREIKRFAHGGAVLKGQKVVFISAGGLEQPAPGPEDGPRERMRIANKMIDRAREAAALLSRRPDTPATFQLFPDEDHGTVLPLHINRGLRILSTQPKR